MNNIVQYSRQNPKKPRRVWFSGSTALVKGQGVCFDLDYLTTTVGETATDKFGARGIVVQAPDAATSYAFAGVTSQAYPAKTGGQWIEIHEPGSICEVATLHATTINATMLTCGIGSAIGGRFTLGGFAGRGSAIALQTKAAATGADITFSSLDGTATNAGTTITKTGIGTACGFGSDTISPTDFYVTIFGGGDDDAVATASRQQVLTAPTADTITVGTTPGTTCYLTLVVTKGSPTVLAYLMDGEQSGLVEYVSPDDNAAAQHLLPAGVTFVCGGYTMTTDNSTSTLADGTVDGMRKGFAGLGTLTTKGYLVTVTSGLVAAGTALTSLAIDAAAEHATLVWHGNFGAGTTGLWRVLEGTATEA
jgi:hypothetical protein